MRSTPSGETLFAPGAEEARTALILWLTEHGWKASAVMDVKSEIPPDTLRIVVGFKPSPFFDPDWVKEMDKKVGEMLRKQKKH